MTCYGVGMVAVNCEDAESAASMPQGVPPGSDEYLGVEGAYEYPPQGNLFAARSGVLVR